MNKIFQQWREDFIDGQLRVILIFKSVIIQIIYTCFKIVVIMSILMGSSWKNYEEIARNEADKLAGILHKIFELSARLSVLPAKYAMKFRLPVWREFVKVADEALGMTRKLVPEMASLGGDGLLYLMKQEGIQDEDLVRIVTDLILAAGDTVSL